MREVRIGRPGPERDGQVAVPVTVSTDIFGTLRGTIALPVSGSGEEAGVDWDFSLRLPGLRADEAVVRRAGPAPRRGSVLAADGSPLDTAGAGRRARADARRSPVRPSGRAAAVRRARDRAHARRRGRSVRTTIDPRLTRAATAALGDRLGGVAVIRPRDGSVRALAGLAVSAPQPPGSVFKIITAAEALDERIVASRTPAIRCGRRRPCRASRCATRAARRAAGR